MAATIESSDVPQNHGLECCVASEVIRMARSTTSFYRRDRRAGPMLGLHARATIRAPSAWLRRCTVRFAVVVAAGVAGCGSGDAPLATVDPDAAPLKPTYDQVAAILNRSCAPCHGGSSSATVTLAVDPDYSQCESTLAELDGLRSTVLQTGSMPPGAWPRLSSEEKLLIERWLDQGACAPCATPCP